jgi:hypothetical protein
MTAKKARKHKQARMQVLAAAPTEWCGTPPQAGV